MNTSCLCGDDKGEALRVRRRCKQLRCSPLVCVCGECVCMFTELCDCLDRHMWRSVSAVLGHQFRAAGLLLLNGPEPAFSESSICCSSVLTEHYIGCNLCLAPHPVTLPEQYGCIDNTPEHSINHRSTQCPETEMSACTLLSAVQKETLNGD